MLVEAAAGAPRGAGARTPGATPTQPPMPTQPRTPQTQQSADKTISSRKHPTTRTTTAAMATLTSPCKTGAAQTQSARPPVLHGDVSVAMAAVVVRVVGCLRELMVLSAVCCV